MPSDKPRIDSVLLLAVTALLVLGIVMVYSASSFKAQEATGRSDYYLRQHFIKVLAAAVMMVVVAKLDHRIWLKAAPVLLGVTLAALVFLLVSPTVEPIRGSRRWLMLGPIQVQPSDFARLALILYLSRALGRTDFRGDPAAESFPKTLGIIALVVFPILLQPDVGTAALIVFVALSLVFLAGERLRHLALLGLGALPLFLLFLKNNDYQRQRILQYIASLRGEDVSWQVQQSLLALGHGGVFGVGLGSGQQKYHFLPDPFTDFIFAIVGEELGLMGTLAILGLLLLIIWRGSTIALLAREPQTRLLAAGVVLNVATYAIANAGVVTNLLPTTGVPMPFISYGGSALMANLFGMGLLLNISARVRYERKLHPMANRYTRGGRGHNHGFGRRH